jgi:16S rRNA (guanine1516-N2)-methyltransferase
MTDKTIDISQFDEDFSVQFGEYALKRIEGKLSLVTNDKRFKPLVIDFLEGKTRHRREYGGGRGQLIAKAIGIKKIDNPTVLDLSAGMGQDAFVLAYLGCRVTMLERSPIIAALLEDALDRLYRNSDQQELSIQLVKADASDYLDQLSGQPDVIYFDPMYPDTKNTALPKKEMRLLREIAGDDPDASSIFTKALTKAKHRVVIKRPRLGDLIFDQEPDVVFEGKSSRFDVYISKK